MKWFTEKKGYLLLLGILCISPMMILAMRLLLQFERGWRLLNIIDDSYMIVAFSVHLVISMTCLAFTIYELEKKQRTFLINTILGLVFSSSVILFYLTVALLILNLIN